MVKSRPSQGKNTKKSYWAVILGHDSLCISPSESHLINIDNAILVLVWLSNDTIKEEMMTENNLG